MKRPFLGLLLLVLAPFPAMGQTNVWTLISTTAGVSPVSRPVNAILPNPKAPDTLYVGTDSGILKVRASTGDTSAAGFGTRIPASVVFVLEANPKNAAVVYAGTAANGVYKTVDGTTWTQLPGQPSGMSTVQSIAVDPQDTTLIYVGTLASGVYRSKDSGATWTAFNRRDSVFTGGSPDSITNVYFLAPHPLSPDTILYAGTLTAGVFKNRGGKANWAPASTGLPTGAAQSLRGLRIDPSNGNVLFAGVASNGFYKSTDGGVSWSKKQGGISGSTDVRALALSPTSYDFLYAGTFSEAMFRSTVKAEIWDPITSLPSGLSARTIAIDPLNVNRAYVGTFNGVYRIDVASAAQITYGVGKGPQAMVSANLDTQALADIAVVNSTDNTVTVLLNKVGAVFTRKDVPSGSGPSSIAVEDVDGDGKKDLIVGSRIGKIVTILRNNGFGGFSFFLDLFVGQAVESVAAADFDGDGDKDIVTANGGANTISIFLNGGRGTFSPPQDFAVGAGPRSVVATDLNGDGRPDVVVAGQTANALSVLINKGGGQLDLGAPVSLSGGPTQVLVKDFNLDGAEDIVALAGRDVALFYGKGDGTFQAPVKSSFAESPGGIVAADLDGDRYPDLAVALGITVSSLINDGKGRLIPGSVLGSAVGVTGVGTADFNGDGRADGIAISAGAGAVVMFQNLLPASIKAPAPPRRLTALDTPADLGGRITLTWEHPRADEETGRTVSYEVFRSGARNGSYTRALTVSISEPFVSRDSTLVRRSVTDSTATLGVPLFFCVTTQNSLGTSSVASDTVTATSSAQPFFNFDFSNLSLYSVGDTVTVQVSLSPLSYQLSGLSLFLDYDSTALALVDGEPGASGIQPFELNAGLLSGGVQVLENRLAAGARGKINLSVGSLAFDRGISLNIGTLRFATPKDTVTALTISNDRATNRRTVLINAADGSTISPNLPTQPSRVVIQNYRVNGRVSFQGRVSNLDLPARVDLRGPRGLPLATAYSPANDQDKNREGVQLTLDKGGGFSLIQVPPGTYAIFVKAFHYLRGRVTGDSVRVGPGLSPAPLTFRWVSATSTAFSDLRGGDANDDNNVNLTDFGLLAKHFGTFGITGAQNPAWVADFNVDGTVDLADFGILSSNFGEQGLGQGLVTKPAAPKARLNIVRDPDDAVYRILVEGESRISGFSADIIWGSSGLALAQGSLSEGEAAQARGLRLWWIARPIAGGLRIAGYVMGDRPLVLEGGGEVALLRLVGPPGDGLPRIENAWLADEHGELQPALTAAELGLPQRAALFQNAPNPFNPETSISYDVPAPDAADGAPDTRVTLRIYNLTGQAVRTLVDAPHAPGRYRITWDGLDYLGRPVASGVYFYRMEMGSFWDVKRMLLLR